MAAHLRITQPSKADEGQGLSGEPSVTRQEPSRQALSIYQANKPPQVFCEQVLLTRLVKQSMPIAPKLPFQLKRNASLKQAADVLKKDARVKGQTVEIDWCVEEVNGARSRDRGVKVAAVIAFVQTEKAMSGTFQKPFAENLREPSFASFYKRCFHDPSVNKRHSRTH